MSDLRKKLTTKFYRAQINLAPKKDSPDYLWGELFQDVQLRQVFPDSITFVDMIPEQAQHRILKNYRRQRHDPHFNLHEFVKKNFKGLLNEDNYVTNPEHSVEQHIDELWGVLTREVPRNTGSLIGLPYPYVVAGGRYIAQYYWDSYFVMLGLAASGRWDMVENMVKNCAFLIRKFGFVPNGNRTYYLTRSQPPFFALMVRLLAEHKGKTVLVRYLPYLLAEHRFWMKGATRLTAKKIAAGRVVRMPDGSMLNRYFDTATTPRPEGYKEDVSMALEATDRTPSRVYVDLRAGAESGWDYSSRWLRDGATLSTIHTTDIIPVDLNCLMYLLEETIADAYKVFKQRRLANHFRTFAAERAEAINKYCWSDEKDFYFDYDFVAGRLTDVPSAAAAFPLFANVASKKQADAVASLIHKKFVKAGGLVTTLHESGQQWDWPNGWAPLQWIAIKGLRNYGYNYLAHEIKQRWITCNVDLFKKEGKLVEKYNVVHPDKPALNGEYVLQDGFGWTNGVLLALLSEEDG